MNDKPPEIFLGDWQNKRRDTLQSRHDMAADFGLDVSDLDGCHIVVAIYVNEDYEGSAYVLFEHAGKLHEIFASHCSCYGLEGQWEPEETTLAAIRYRLRNQPRPCDLQVDLMTRLISYFSGVED